MLAKGPFDPATGERFDSSVPFVDLNPALGQEGSVVPATFFNDVNAEVGHLIDHYLGDGTDGSGQDENDLEQLRKSVERATGADGTGVLKSNPGYMIHPSGLIFQFGNVAISGSDSTIVFPIAFPTEVVSLTFGDFSTTLENTTPGGSSPAHIIHALITSPEVLRAQFTVAASNTSGVAGGSLANWFAVGY